MQIIVHLQHENPCPLWVDPPTQFNQKSIRGGDEWREKGKEEGDETDVQRKFLWEHGKERGEREGGERERGEENCPWKYKGIRDKEKDLLISQVTQ